MKKMLNILITLLVLSLPAVAASSDNSCVDCHAKLTKPREMIVYFKEWEGSVHAKKGTTCEKCHGGESGIISKKGAHTGILNSSNPKSRIHDSRVSETCGSCHFGAYSTFRQSKHFELIAMEGKQGPNCVTCHGGRKNSLLSPSRMINRCRVCHSTRGTASVESLEEAHRVLLFVDSVGRQLKDLQNKAISLEKAGIKQDQMLPTIRKATTIFYKIGEQWHNFEIEETYGLASEVRFLIDFAQKEMRTSKRYLAYGATLFVILLAGVLIYILRRRDKS